MGQVEPASSRTNTRPPRPRPTRDTPIDAARVGAVFAAYEQVKRANGVVDFEDLLRAAVWAIEEHPDVAEQVHAQYRHFVVDEYQDVNPLQQRLLDAWLGGRARPDRGRRREPDHLLVHRRVQRLPARFPRRSAPRRGRGPAGPRLPLDPAGRRRRQRGDPAGPRRRGAGCGSNSSASDQAGPEPEIRFFPDEPAEAAAVAARCAELIAGGVPAREIAVLFRTNAQSEAYEEALAEAGVPTWCTAPSGSSSGRRSARRWSRCAPPRSRRRAETPLVDAVVAALEAVGWRPDGRRPVVPPGNGGRRWRRWPGWPRSSAETGAVAGRKRR